MNETFLYFAFGSNLNSKVSFAIFALELLQASKSYEIIILADPYKFTNGQVHWMGTID